jgi:hypothetical protein
MRIYILLITVMMAVGCTPLMNIGGSLSDTVPKGKLLAKIDYGDDHRGGAVEVVQTDDGFLALRGQYNWRSELWGAGGMQTGNIAAPMVDINRTRLLDRKYNVFYAIADLDSGRMIYSDASEVDGLANLEMRSTSDIHSTLKEMGRIKRDIERNDVYPTVFPDFSNQETNVLGLTEISKTKITSLPLYYGAAINYQDVRAYSLSAPALNWLRELAAHGCNGKLWDSFSALRPAECPLISDGIQKYLLPLITGRIDKNEWLQPIPGLQSDINKARETRLGSLGRMALYMLAKPSDDKRFAARASGGIDPALREILAAVRLATPQPFDLEKPRKVIFFGIAERENKIYSLSYNAAKKIVDDAHAARVEDVCRQSRDCDYRYTQAAFVDAKIGKTIQKTYYYSPSQLFYNPSDPFEIYGKMTSFGYFVNVNIYKNRVKKIMWYDGVEKVVSD